MCGYTYVWVQVCVEVQDCLSESFWITLLHLIHWGRISELNPEPMDVATSAGQLTLGTPPFPLSEHCNYRQATHPPSFSVGTGALISGPQACSMNGKWFSCRAISPGLSVAFINLCSHYLLVVSLVKILTLKNVVTRPGWRLIDYSNLVFIY